jgi:hypothetical protein
MTVYALTAEPLGAQLASLGVISSATAAPFRYQIGRRVTYVCPAVAASQDVVVWGTDVYSFDSAVCPAAVHAGVLGQQQAGTVTFLIGPGSASFTGSVRNGVTTDSYTGYDSSFTFDRGGELGRIDGITTMRLPAGFTGSVGVVCPPLGTFAHPLWGTDIYAEDSSICAAAVHAGVIGLDAGGPVRVTAAGPQPSFGGSVRNRVTSQNYTQWPISFTVGAPSSTQSPESVAAVLVTPLPATALLSPSPTASEPVSLILATPPQVTGTSVPITSPPAAGSSSPAPTPLTQRIPATREAASLAPANCGLLTNLRATSSGTSIALSWEPMSADCVAVTTAQQEMLLGYLMVRWPGTANAGCPMTWQDLMATDWVEDFWSVSLPAYPGCVPLETDGPISFTDLGLESGETYTIASGRCSRPPVMGNPIASKSACTRPQKFRQQRA